MTSRNRTSYICTVLVLFLALSVSAQQMIGGFWYKKSKDPITDEIGTAIGTAGKRPGGGSPILAWRCDGGEFTVNYWFDTVVSGESVVLPQYRFDAKPPKTGIWELGGGGKAARIANRAEVLAFTDEAVAASKVVVRVSDRDCTLTDTFSLVGLSRALRQLPCVALARKAEEEERIARARRAEEEKNEKARRAEAERRKAEEDARKAREQARIEAEHRQALEKARQAAWEEERQRINRVLQNPDDFLDVQRYFGLLLGDGTWENTWAPGNRVRRCAKVIGVFPGANEKLGVEEWRLKEGDLILEIGRDAVTSADDAYAKLHRSSSAKNYLFLNVGDEKRSTWLVMLKKPFAPLVPDLR